MAGTKVFIEWRGRRREVFGWRKWVIAIPLVIIAALALAVAIVFALGLAVTLGVVAMIAVPTALILGLIALTFGGLRTRTTVE